MVKRPLQDNLLLILKAQEFCCKEVRQQSTSCRWECANSENQNDAQNELMVAQTEKNNQTKTSATTKTLKSCHSKGEMLSE